MPRRRFKRKRRKSFKRKRRRRRMRIPMGVREKTVVRLKYMEDSIILDPSSTSFVTHHFRTMDLNNPDVDLTGHSPRYFDQYMDLYQKYTVINAKAIFDFYYESSTVAAVRVYAGSSVIPAEPITQGRAAESKYVKSRPLTHNGNKVTARIVINVNSAKFFNKRNIVAATDFTGGLTVGPFKTGFIYCGAAGFTGSTIDPGKVLARLQMIYTVVFHQPIMVPQSAG